MYVSLLVKDVPLALFYSFDSLLFFHHFRTSGECCIKRKIPCVFEAAKKRGPKGGPRSCGTGDDLVRHLEAENARLRCEGERMRAMIVSLGGSVEALDDPMDGGSGCGGDDCDDVDGDASGAATPAACAALTALCAATAQAKAAVVAASSYAARPLTGAGLCVGRAAPSSSAAWAREAPVAGAPPSAAPAAGPLERGGSSRLASFAPSMPLASAAASPSAPQVSLFATTTAAAGVPAPPPVSAAPGPSAPPPGTSSAAPPGAKCPMAAAAAAFFGGAGGAWGGACKPAAASSPAVAVPPRPSPFAAPTPAPADGLDVLAALADAARSRASAR